MPILPLEEAAWLMFKTQVSYRQGFIKEAAWSTRGYTVVVKVKVGFLPFMATLIAAANDGNFDFFFTRIFHVNHEACNLF